MPDVDTSEQGASLHRLTAPSRALSYEASLSDLLRITVETAESLLGAEKVVLLLQEPDDRLEIRAARGVSDEAAKRFDASLDETLFSRLSALLGDERPASLVGVPLLARGRVRGLLVVLLDESARAERDEWVLSALADQASAVLEHALQEAANEDLTSRLQELHARGRRQEQALQVVRHDLATPIGAIRGYLDLLERNAYGPLRPRQKIALGRIEVAVSHLEALVEEALEMSRLHAGDVRPACQPVQIRPVIDEALGMVEIAARDARVRLRADVPEGLSVMGDEGRLRQVLVHLLDNAIKHGGVEGEVLVTAVEDDWAETATLRITDDGPGVTPEVANEIFEPYKTFGERGGSGLGLAIARAVTELMGGEIGMESGGPSGAMFFVRLPRARETFASH
jgi:signal transduction histidine kinase